MTDNNLSPGQKERRGGGGKGNKSYFAWTETTNEMENRKEKQIKKNIFAFLLFSIVEFRFSFAVRMLSFFLRVPVSGFQNASQFMFAHFSCAIWMLQKNIFLSFAIAIFFSIFITFCVHLFSYPSFLLLCASGVDSTSYISYFVCSIA